VRGVAVAFVAFVAFVVGCKTVPVIEPVRFDLDEERVGKDGPRCGRAVKVVTGPMPVSTREAFRYTLLASRPVSLDEMKTVLAAAAVKTCVDGVAILQAVVDDGGVDVSSVNAVSWVRLVKKEQNDAEAPADVVHW